MIIKQDSSYFEHFYKDLKPYEHYIPMKHDLSDVMQQIQWAKDNDSQASRLQILTNTFNQTSTDYFRLSLMPSIGTFGFSQRWPNEAVVSLSSKKIFPSKSSLWHDTFKTTIVPYSGHNFCKGLVVLNVSYKTHNCLIFLEIFSSSFKRFSVVVLI